MKKVAVVCGGTSGIGNAVRKHFALRGWITANLARTAERGDDPCHTGHPVDLTDAFATEQAVSHVIAQHGRVDALVHAVGDIYEPLCLEDLSWERWQRSFDLCVGTAVNVLRPLLPHIRVARGACAFVSSVAALHPYRGIADYCAVKAALDSLVRSVATEEARHGVRANSILPAVVDTPLFARSAFTKKEAASWHALGRLGSSEEVASMVVHLVTDEGSWITGQSIVMDGGMMLPK